MDFKSVEWFERLKKSNEEILKDPSIIKVDI